MRVFSYSGIIQEPVALTRSVVPKQHLAKLSFTKPSENQTTLLDFGFEPKCKSDDTECLIAYKTGHWWSSVITQPIVISTFIFPFKKRLNF
jgi:hypothetical protein